MSEPYLMVREDRKRVSGYAVWLFEPDTKPVRVKSFYNGVIEAERCQAEAHQWAAEHGVAGAREELAEQARKAEQERLAREERERIEAERQTELNERKYF